MKVLKKIGKMIAMALFSTAMIFSGCDNQAPFEVSASDTANPVEVNESGHIKASDYPMLASRTFKFQGGSYQGGRINLANGSAFVVGNGAITPPPGTPRGQDLTITVEIELIERSRKDRELIVSFQPSGCQFGPNAELWLDWHELGSKNANLYLIDADGNRIPESADSYDRRGKKIMRLIPHFSRYALVRG